MPCLRPVLLWAKKKSGWKSKIEQSLFNSFFRLSFSSFSFLPWFSHKSRKWIDRKLAISTKFDCSQQWRSQHKMSREKILLINFDFLTIHLFSLINYRKILVQENGKKHRTERSGKELISMSNVEFEQLEITWHTVVEEEATMNELKKEEVLVTFSSILVNFWSTDALIFLL